MQNSKATVQFSLISSTIILLSVLIIATPVFSSEPPPPSSWNSKSKSLSEISQYTAPSIDARKELQADNQKGQLWPLRYAVSFDAKITPYTHGTWETIQGGSLWRLRVTSKGSTDLNFGFTGYWMPDGSTLHIWTENDRYVQGPYTESDNQPHGQLWTPVTPGDSAVIEMFVPENSKQKPVLVLTRINSGYRDLFGRSNDPIFKESKSGSCNIMVACPEADEWRDEIRSVARYSVDGNGLCSGTLVMNTARDYKNYFLTADHCGISPANAASVVVYWNYNSAGCNTQSGGSLKQNQSGAFFRAAKSDVDMALIELDDMPKAAFNVYYAGWDRSSTIPSGVVGIHHPRGDTKAISFSYNPLTSIDSCISEGFNTHWNVEWSDGVTEPGSSGSAIWNSANKKIVGFLSGGASQCGGFDQSDCYGKFSVAWNSGPSSASRLKDWLDPLNTGEESIEGSNMVIKASITAAGATITRESCLPRNRMIDPGETVTVNFSLSNVGNARATNVMAVLLATNGVMQSRTNFFGLMIPGGKKTTRPFQFTANGVCGESITPSFELWSVNTYLGRVDFPFRLGRLIASSTENFDQVLVPALPAGWDSESSLYGTGWSTTQSRRFSRSQSVFASGYEFNSANYLYAPPVNISVEGAQISFRHMFNLESGYDGAILEVSIDDGEFLDILDAGGSFAQGGYNRTMLGESLIDSTTAWSGKSAGFILTTVNLPAAFKDKTIQFRWRMETDFDISSLGWYIDNYTILNEYLCCP